jgi:hypothetical protein
LQEEGNKETDKGQDDHEPEQLLRAAPIQLAADHCGPGPEADKPPAGPGEGRVVPLQGQESGEDGGVLGGHATSGDQERAEKASRDNS